MTFRRSLAQSVMNEQRVPTMFAHALLSSTSSPCRPRPLILILAMHLPSPPSIYVPTISFAKSVLGTRFALSLSLFCIFLVKDKNAPSELGHLKVSPSTLSSCAATAAAAPPSFREINRVGRHPDDNESIKRLRIILVRVRRLTYHFIRVLLNKPQKTAALFDAGRENYSRNYKSTEDMGRQNACFSSIIENIKMECYISYKIRLACVAT